MNNKLIYLSLLVFLSLAILPLVSAEYLPHKLNTDLQFSITSNNATSCNISSYDYPNGTYFIDDIMTKNGQTFNVSFNYLNFTTIGTYCFNVVCTDGIKYEGGSVCREVTPSGSQISSGKSIGLFGSILLMIIISSIFLIIAFKSENSVGKIAFFCFSGIGFIMTILYTVVIMQQTLFGFDSILTGIDTFWFVMKTFAWIAFVGFMVAVLLVMLKAWKIKRGIIDID